MNYHHKLLNNIFSIVKKSCSDEGMEQADYRFSRKIIRDATSWGNTQLKIHLARLEDMEYLLVHKGGRGQSIVYELLYRGEGIDGNSFMLGLTIMDKSIEKQHYDKKKSPLNGKKSVPSRPQVGAKSGGGRTSKTPLSTNDTNSLEQINGKTLKNACLGVEKNSNQNNRTHALN